MFDDLMAHIDARPKNCGPMKDASARTKFTGACGDTVEIWLRIDGGKIRKASYMTDGCGYSNACTSAAAKLAEGMTPDEAKNMTQSAVLERVGSIPVDHQHCALLAATVVQMAVFDYLEKPAPRSFRQQVQAFFNP